MARVEKMDWHSAELTPETVITESYKNTQNVRRFFRAYAGADFKFNVGFMAWMKANVGKTLGEAVLVYLDGREGPSAAEIAEQTEYNQYVRDFFRDNPELGMADVNFCCAKKRGMPSADGRYRYERADLRL